MCQFLKAKVMGKPFNLKRSKEGIWPSAGEGVERALRSQPCKQTVKRMSNAPRNIKVTKNTWASFSNWLCTRRMNTAGVTEWAPRFTFGGTVSQLSPSPPSPGTMARLCLLAP